MKNFLKKIKNNWLDYLVIFISLLAVCFVYTFTAFYQPKESEKTINKENIVKVLRDKKNIRGPLGATDFGSIVIGETLSDINDSEIKYIVNFSNIELFEYKQNSFVEFEIEFETMSSLYLYKNKSAYLESDNIYKTFSINFEMPLSNYYSGNKPYTISIGTEDFSSVINDIYLDDMETFFVNIYYEISLYIYIDTEEGNILFQNVYDYVINGEVAIDVRDQTANEYVNSLSSLFEDSTTRYIPNQLRLFNLYDVGFDTGYNDGYNNGQEIGYNNGYDYGQEIGYNNGYNDGVIAGSNNFNILNLIRSLFDLVWSVLSVEMLPNIKLIYIVAIPLVLSVIKFILGWFR